MQKTDQVEPPPAPGETPSCTLHPLVRFGSPLLAIALIAGAVLLLSRPWDKATGIPPGSAALREAERLGAQDQLAPKKGERAPDFALRSLDGEVVRLSELRGHTVLINFWATWCNPCRAEMPDLEAVYQQQKDRDLVILGINVENADPEEARKLARDFRDGLGVSFPILLDGPTGDVFQQYRLRGMPSSFLVDRDGIIREITFGPMKREQILQKLDATRRGGG